MVEFDLKTPRVVSMSSIAFCANLFGDSASLDTAGLYTLKELLGYLGPVFVAGVAATWAVTHAIHSKRNRETERREESLRHDLQIKQQELGVKSQEAFAIRLELSAKDAQIDRMRSDSPPREQELKHVEEQLADVREQLSSWLTLHSTATDQLTSTRELAEKLQNQLVETSGTLAAYEDELGDLRSRLRKAMQKDGMIWSEKVKFNAPEFKPLAIDGRRTPIISVLNLKGGVGKTTVTANLGAALAEKGYRVLLIDLDLQGSLSGLFLQPSVQEQALANEKHLEDFLAHSFDAEFPNLNDFIHPVLGNGSAIVPTGDTLAYAEMNLTIRWLLRDGNRDPRFLLRRELHLKRITNRFDIVLLDCPPIMNVSCINALGASDYLIIPVVPGRQASIRVPALLKRLKGFCENVIHPSFDVLGIVANRTHGVSLTNAEQNGLTDAVAYASDAWGRSVTSFETNIPQNREVREAEEEIRPLSTQDNLFEAFRLLAADVERRLPSFCRRMVHSATGAQA